MMGPMAVVPESCAGYTWGMRACCLILLGLFLLPHQSVAAKKKRRAKTKPAATQKDKGTASKDTIKLVEHVTLSDTGALNPELIPAFMEVDRTTLPGRLRAAYDAKVAELESLRKISEGKGKAPIRRAGKEEITECDPEHNSLQYVQMLPKNGFDEISQDEENFLLKRTKCTQCELMLEFSLKIVIVPPQGKQKHHTSYRFLSQSDPLMALVAQYRSKHVGTNFFGAFAGACR
jgi:hypothetical protein